MDQVKKWTLYLMFLVAGFATGIGTLGLFPQFWLQYGITGMAVHVAFLALFTYVAILEAEVVMNSGYYFVELYRKVARRPAMIVTILAAVVLFISYYAANVMLSILSPVVGTGTVGRLIAKLLMLAIVFLILTRAKEKTFAIMAVGSLVFVVSVVITAIAFKTQIPENATFLGLAKHMLITTTPITLDLIRDAAMRAIYGVGLGFAFYLMLGSFLNERFNPRIIIGTGILIQLLVSLLSTVIVVYAIAPTTPERLLSYVYGGDEGAIALMADLPNILSGYPILLGLIAISLFFAGVTSLLPTAEVGLQITESLLKIGRNRAAAYIIGAAAIIGVLDSVPAVADMALKTVTATTFFTAVYELYPVMTSREKPSLRAILGGIAIVMFLIGGVYAVVTDFRAGGLYIASGLLAVALVVFGVLGDRIVPLQEEAI